MCEVRNKRVKLDLALAPLCGRHFDLPFQSISTLQYFLQSKAVMTPRLRYQINVGRYVMADCWQLYIPQISRGSHLGSAPYKHKTKLSIRFSLFLEDES